MALPRNISKRNSKFDSNINKRGKVDIGKAAKRKEDPPVATWMIVMFMILVVGSSVVGVLNLFSKTPDI